MSYYGNFSTHKVVEMNFSTGLRIGHMAAQTKFVKGEHPEDFLDNGFILALDIAKDELVKAQGDEETLFIHFTEEHMPILNAGLKYFTVPFMKGNKEDGSENYCYPRAIALHVNDVWTTDNYSGDLPEEGVAQAVVENGVLTIGTPDAGQHVFLVKKVTLPDAVTEAGQFIYVGRAK